MDLGAAAALAWVGSFIRPTNMLVLVTEQALGEFAEAGQRERRLLLTLTQVERRGLLVHSLVRAVLMNRTLRLLVLAHSGIE